MEKMRVNLHGCYNCGKTHIKSDKCPAADSTCRYCTLKGSWASVCLKKKLDQESEAKRQQQHTVYDNGDSDKEDDNFVLNTIETMPLPKLESIFKNRSKFQAFMNIQM